MSEAPTSDGPLELGLDYEFNADGLMVLTRHFLLKRGYCCKNGCLHCPYGYTAAASIEP